MLVKRFSQILNTNSAAGFIRGRKYDTDMNRLGRMETSQRELHKELGSLRKESRNLTISGELKKERKNLWQRDTE